MRSHAIAVSLQTKTLEKYACVLSKCEERNNTAIVSQKINIKVGLKNVTRSRKTKNKLVVQRKRCLLVSSQNVFINSNETLATSDRITEEIQRLHTPIVTFQDEFIGGLFQGMLSGDAAAPRHELIQFFNSKLNNLNDETVLLNCTGKMRRQVFCLLRMSPYL